MAIHDTYARLTPYELLLPDPGFAEERFRAIREELVEEPEARGDPGRFVVLEAVADTLEELKGPREDQEQLHQHGLLLYHAFHFREAGRPLFLLGTHAARYLVEAGPGGGGSARAGEGGASDRGEEEGDREAPGGEEKGGPRREAGPVSPPEPAGYVQLPRNLFWIRPGGERPPEPADGFFWSAGDEERISLLVAAGIREDRPGFSVIPLPPVPLSDSAVWLDTPIREEGEDFESTLPGGEIERLYSLEALGEVLKLAARIFRHLEAVPGAATAETAPAERDASDEPGVGGRPPRPTSLEYWRVELTDEGREAERDDLDAREDDAE